MKMLTIPEARSELRCLAEALRIGAMTDEQVASAIELVANRMYRTWTKPVTARAKARHMTKIIRDEIKRFHKKNPAMSCREIGRHFNVDGGRVSETLAGKYDNL